MAAIKTEMLPSHAADTGGGGGGGATGGGGGSNGAQSTATTSNVDGSVVATAAAPTAVGSVSNNTISAAADSSDNQPSTPQPQPASSNNALIGNEQQQHQSTSGSSLLPQPYGSAHHMYSTSTPVSSGNASVASLPHMYTGIYASSASGAAQQDVQQQHNTVGGYPTYLNSYEQFYQQQQQHSPAGQANDYGGSNAPLMYGTSSNGNDYKPPQSSANVGVRYHPYLQTPTSCVPNANNGNVDGADVTASAALPLANSSAAVSTTTNSMSPRVVSSSSPTSTSAAPHMQLGGIGGNGNNNSLSPGSCKLQCKKCGIMCISDAELQEHITNVHGASPYGSSGYSSSPYIKEELSSGSQQQQQQQQSAQQQTGGGNPGDILDLDSQKMVYPPTPGSIQSLLHHPLPHQHGQQQLHDNVDPLHSMHSMQQRALPSWDQPTSQSLQEGLPPYMHHNQHQHQHQHQSQPTDLKPYYSPKQSPYHSGSVSSGLATSGGAVIKQEYPIIKSEYPDSQNYLDKSFDPTSVGGAGDMCQQQQQPPSVQQQQQSSTQQMMPVSSSPAEFPSTTTGGPQDQQQQYRGFEPPTSSSVLASNSITAKAATWKSNEARRPKTYNCTACNKWFTSSGHLKRHYNTTLHKNAVKSSGQPDPATLPISAHHHPARDPSVTKNSRRSSANAAAAAAAAAAQQQQQNAATVQPAEQSRNSPDFTQPPGLGQISQYSASPSPTQQPQVNGLSYGQTPNGYQLSPQQQQQQQQQQYMQQVQSSTHGMTGASSNAQTALNGHPNGLAGPSALITTTPPPMPSSHTRGLLNTTPTTTTTTIITKIEPMEEDTHHMLITQSPPALVMDPRSDSESAAVSGSGSGSAPSPMDMEMEQQRRQLEEEAEAAAAVAAEQLQEQQQHRQRRQQAELVEQEQVELAAACYRQQLEQQQQLLQQYHNSNSHSHSSSNSNSTTPIPTNSPPPNMRVPSPLIISHQHFQAQLQQPPPPQQAMVDSIFSRIPLPPHQPVHMQQPQPPPANIMDPQYSIIPLGISTPQLLSSNMQLLQQPLPTTTSTATTTNMDSIHMLPPSHHHHHQQQPQSQPLPSMPNTLLSSTSIQSQLGTISTTITPQPLQHTTTTTTAQLLPPLQQQPPQLTTSTIPCYQQLPPASELAPLEHTMTYHTIIGNGNANLNGDINLNDNGDGNLSVNVNGGCGTELLQVATLDSFGNLQPQQMLATANGQILQFVPSTTTLMGQPLFTLPAMRAATSTTSSSNTGPHPRSPQEGDLPPAHTIMPGASLGRAFAAPQTNDQTQQQLIGLPSYSPTVTSSTLIDDYSHMTTVQQNDEATDQQSQEFKPQLLMVSSNSNESATISPASMKKPRRSVANSVGPKRKRESNNANNSNANNSNVKKTDNAIKSSNRSVVVRASMPASQTLPTGRIKCLECNKEFTKSCYLTQHNKSFHSGEYPYRCQKCGKRFQDEDVYMTHLDRHQTRDKPHKCERCPKQFHHKTDLRRHVDAIHTGFKQHVCNICEKSFCRKDHLRKHIETHTRPRVQGKRVLKATVDVEVLKMRAAQEAGLGMGSGLGLGLGVGNGIEDKYSISAEQQHQQQQSLTQPHCVANIVDDHSQKLQLELQHEFKLEPDDIELEQESLLLSDGDDTTAVAAAAALTSSVSTSAAATTTIAAATVLIDTESYVRHYDNHNINDSVSDEDNSTEYFMIYKSETDLDTGDNIDATKELCAYY